MKKFLIKVLIFLGSIVSILLLPILILRLMDDRISENLALPPNIDTIIIGDSHTQCALNDSLIPNSINISLDSESYYYSYPKLKKIIKNNANIRYIIIGYAYHSLSAIYDSTIICPYATKRIKSCSEMMINRYFLIFDNHLIQSMIKFPFVFLNCIFTSSKKSINLIYHFSKNDLKFHDFPFWGHYLKTNLCKLNDYRIQTAINRHFYLKSGQKIADFSEIQQDFLCKIIEFSKEKKKNLILLNTPIHYRYYAKVPKQFSVYYYTTEQTHKNVTLIDDHKFSLPNNCWRDGDHLNYQGALLYSKYFANELNKMRCLYNAGSTSLD